MKLTKILLLAFALLLCFALAACDGTDEPQETSAHEHAWSAWETVKEATCTEDGLQERTCKCGEVVQEVINATGHNYNATVTAPTAKDQGYTTHTCANCGDSYIDTYVPATGSLGLAYEVNADGTSCTITGMGTCDDTEIYINEKIDGYTVTAIKKRAFRECKSIEVFSIPNTVTSIGDSAFEDCWNLVSITIPDSVTNIGKYAFASCYDLSSITIPDSVTNIGKRAFEFCKSLTSVTIGNSVTIIDDYAFWYCEALEHISIPDSVTSIGESAFANCKSLIIVTIGNGVTSIGDYAFEYCKELNELTIGNSVKTIGDFAFNRCSRLESISIPMSVKDIGDFAFAYLDIEIFNYEGTYSQWNAIKKAYSWKAYSHFAKMVFTDVTYLS